MERPGPDRISASIILALGILSLFGFGLLAGIPAWILGNDALKRIRRGDADSRDESLVKIGRVIGMVVTLLNVLVVVAVVLFLMIDPHGLG